MQTLIELAPLIAFFGVFKWGGGIYPATATLMVAMALLLAWDWLRTRKIPQMHLVSAVLVWVFGTATLLLRDVRFLQWKATVFYGIVALAFAGTVWIGRMTLLERLLGKNLPEGVTVTPATWRNLSLLSAAFYALLGAANLWVAFTFSLSTWVAFKTWAVVPLIFVFTAGLIFWLMRGHKEPAA
ncbi:MAG TPA: inner membrane-spanning protein YciB [Steroidobacteraceae bacterium]|nr:inner membrane-spanning protein YciB [Steroidobacteraceae bacterium]